MAQPPGNPPLPLAQAPMNLFARLPTELFCMIIRNLDIRGLIRLCLAIYPVLERRGIAPPLSHDILHCIAHSNRPPLQNLSPRILDLPQELVDNILLQLEEDRTTEKLAFVFAHPSLLWRYSGQGITFRTFDRLVRYMDELDRTQDRTERFARSAYYRPANG